MTATFKPDGKMLGPVGTVDLLIDDGRGATITASLPITVKPSIRPPIVEAPRTLVLAPTALAIKPPTDPDSYPLSVVVQALPRGVVRLGNTVIKPGDRLHPEDLANLNIMPEPGLTGAAGSLRYLVEDGRGGSTEGRLDVEVAGTPGATQHLAAAAPPPSLPRRFASAAGQAGAGSRRIAAAAAAGGEGAAGGRKPSRARRATGAGCSRRRHPAKWFPGWKWLPGRCRPPLRRRRLPPPPAAGSGTARIARRWCMFPRAPSSWGKARAIPTRCRRTG